MMQHSGADDQIKSRSSTGAHQQVGSAGETGRSCPPAKPYSIGEHAKDDARLQHQHDDRRQARLCPSCPRLLKSFMNSIRTV